MYLNQKTEYYLADIGTLVPYARNARTHSPEQVAQIAASIREFGFLSPVVTTKDGTILCGHGRFYAAQKLGLKKIPCIREDHLTEAQRRTLLEIYRAFQAENRAGETPRDPREDIA